MSFKIGPFSNLKHTHPGIVELKSPPAPPPTPRGQNFNMSSKVGSIGTDTIIVHKKSSWHVSESRYHASFLLLNSWLMGIFVFPVLDFRLPSCPHGVWPMARYNIQKLYSQPHVGQRKEIGCSQQEHGITDIQETKDLRPSHTAQNTLRMGTLNVPHRQGYFQVSGDIYKLNIKQNIMFSIFNKCQYLPCF